MLVGISSSRDSFSGSMFVFGGCTHQKFQVPKMEGFLKLIAGYFGGRFSLTAYTGEDSSILGMVKYPSRNS